ncbi:MAG: hypothetical protein QXZ13_03055 [Candidatus Diapherotrites archaeon]
MLLIGGAVVVAAVVIVLLLGTGSTSGGQTEASSAAALCTQKTAVQGQAVPDCDCNSQAGNCSGVSAPAANQTLRVVWVGNKCYQCGGTYSNCTATVTTAYNSEGCKSI